MFTDMFSLWMEIEPMIIAIHRQYARVHQLIHGAGHNFDKLKAGFTLSGISLVLREKIFMENF